jgi:hypothetical protein
MVPNRLSYKELVEKIDNLRVYRHSFTCWYHLENDCDGELFGGVSLGSHLYLVCKKHFETRSSFSIIYKLNEKEMFLVKLLL